MSRSPHSHFSRWIKVNVALSCALLLLLAVVASVAADWEPTAQAEASSSARSSPASRVIDATLNRDVLQLQGWPNEYLVNGPATPNRTLSPLETIQIPVYFHVIRASNGEGDVPESRLDAQINVLNNAFNGASTAANLQFFFYKAGVTRDTNNVWFNMLHVTQQDESAAEHEAKRRLRQGGANALNFYTISANPPPGAQYPQGWAPFPIDYASNPCRDGVVVPFTTLPGDTNPNNPFNAGDLPVHEVGHWLGLFHTHQNGCADNDLVNDTPAHLNQFVGECPPVTTDTCPNSPGTDPIHNYMTDYSDACKSEFTSGQFQRMRDQYFLYRQSTTAPACPVVTMSINDASVAEGNSGNTAAVFTVTLSRASSQTIRVSFATASGTATASVDYFSGSNGTLSFAPGQTSQSLPVTVRGDTVVEPNETFFVNLSTPTNAALGDSQGIGTIINDDGAPVYEGNVDVANCNSISGWAADRNRLNTSITVAIYDGATFVTSVLAGDLRSDVGSYLGDNGRHGFTIPTPARFKDGQSHTLRVKFESSTTELTGSNKTLNCVTYYEIVARHSGKCLDIAGGSTTSGAMLTQWTCLGIQNQQFLIVSVGGGYSKIVARHSGKVLDVQWGSLDNGAPVWQMDENGTPAQQWQIIDIGGGYSRIIARHSGKALDVAGGFTTNGTQVHQWDYVGIPNQQWLIRAVP